METKKEIKKNWFHRLMFGLNILSAVALLFSYAASSISPEKIWWLAFFGLGYGTLLFINFLFALFWMSARSKKSILSLIIIVCGAGKIFNIFEIHYFSSEPVHKKEGAFPIKVMSFNVRLFDLYNWMHNSETREKIFDFLSKESPDILCLQEYYTNDSIKSGFKNNDTLKKIIPAAYSNIEYSTTQRETYHWGIAMFSKLPIISKQAVHFQATGGNIFIYSDVLVGSDTVRVYNAHLESIRFRQQDYKFIENLGSDVEQDEVKESLNILSRLKPAFIKRARQVEVLHQHIKESPYPVIVCGDFNDTPSSYTFSRICDGLEDSFRESGSGPGKTYAGAFPSFRIDYILHDPKFTSAGYRTIHEKLSDHYPISCWIEKR
ncbi:MAG: endonuclease/exonuclease/phosphatase family protein [Bacteroidetes bacterium]|nr:endonuclease/exonuclease/phosphatase family protein [Bacteroidota bacterium]